MGAGKGQNKRTSIKGNVFINDDLATRIGEIGLIVNKISFDKHIRDNNLREETWNSYYLGQSGRVIGNDEINYVITEFMRDILDEQFIEYQNIMNDDNKSITINLLKEFTKKNYYIKREQINPINKKHAFVLYYNDKKIRQITDRWISDKVPASPGCIPTRLALNTRMDGSYIFISLINDLVLNTDYQGWS